ncbi:MAG: hypothetical protein FWD19_00690 [Defluviitaleaceae bacterium]|nr:hypothetical protein [Defluviitaleaceae bacterium]
MNENKKTERDSSVSRGGSFHERRKQADWVIKLASVLSLISWLTAFVVWVLLDIAAPDRMNAQIGAFGPGSSSWNETLLPITFFLLIFAFCSCVAAFIFNMMRMRRKTDKYRKSIIIIGVMTLVGLVAFTLQFGSVLF